MAAITFPNAVQWTGDGHGSGQVLLYDANGNPVVMRDQAPYTPGTQGGVPAMGADRGAVVRLNRTTRGGEVGVKKPTMWFWDPVEGSTLNTVVWASSVSTMTTTQSAGAITMNANNTTTVGAFAILTSQKQIPYFHNMPVVAEVRAQLVQKTNCVYEVGFGAPSGATALVNNGAFLRVDAAGNLKFIWSFNGTETPTIVAGALSSTTFYLFWISVEGARAHLVVEDSSGVPVIDQWIAAPVTLADGWAVTHLPIFARIYNNTAPATAGQILIGEALACTENVDAGRPWSHQMASMTKQALVHPTTFLQTSQLAAGAAPTAITPSNTVGGNAFLGGEFVLNATATSENLLSVAAFTIPTPYSLMLTGWLIPPPVITTTLGASAYIVEIGFVANCATGNISTGGGQRVSLGFFTATSAQAAGTAFASAGGIIDWVPVTPIQCFAGTVLHLWVKVILGATTGVYRMSWTPDGYFE